MRPPNPKLPNIECDRCEPDNRLMEHVGWTSERVEGAGPHACDDIALFKCSQCRRPYREAHPRQ